MIAVDHIRIPSRDARKSATQLANILGAAAPTTAGRDGEMSCVNIDHQPTLLFDPDETISVTHVAFRADPATFTEVLTRLQQLGIPYGNLPQDPTNGRTDDFQGSPGRVFFLNEDGHLFEVICQA